MATDPVQKLLDIHEIQQALLKYAIALDARQPDLMDQVFTKDAEIVLSGTGTFTVESYKKLSGEVLPQLETTQHFCGAPVIRIAGDRAWTPCYFIAQHSRTSLAPEPFLIAAGHYDDELVRVGDSWRISKRTGVSTWVDGNTAVLGFPIPPGGLPWLTERNCPEWLLRR